MKFKIGKHSSEFEAFDDEGKPLKLWVSEMHMHLYPGEMTKIDMTVYVDEADIEVDDEYLSVYRKKRK